MSFVSYSFAVFFAVVVALRLLLASRRAHPALMATLLVASFVFYASTVPWHLLLLLGSSGVDVWAGRRIAAAPVGSSRRRWLLVLPLVINLSLLAFFKYYLWILVWLGVHVFSSPAVALGLLPAWAVTLPLGISFFTFEAMSYAIDVYRGRIERVRRPRLAGLSTGAYLMIRGFFLKMVVADNLSPVVEKLWAPAAEPGASATIALLAPVLFAVQILCDFDGYTSIARGTAYVLGFRLPDNFEHPYIARSFQDFWNRWHITLSHWLRDYLYIPLGGNRVGRGRMYVNLMIVMVLGGVWHGAGLTFVAWGALHGTALVVERALGLHAIQSGRPRWLRARWMVAVQAVVLAAWVFFRSPTFSVATGILYNAAFGSYRALEDPWLGWRALLFVAPTFAGHALAWLRENGIAPPSTPLSRAVAGAGMLYLTFALFAPESPKFIYFQF